MKATSPIIAPVPQNIVVTTFKGGNTKTTCAVNIAESLARQGYGVNGLDLDRTNVDFCAYAPNLPFNVRSLTPGRLGSWVRRPGPHYQVIDCPPAASRTTGLALRHGDLAVVPVTCNLLGIRGLQRVVDLLEAVRDPDREGSNPNLKVLIVITMYDHTDEDARDFESQLREVFGDAIWAQNIPVLKPVNAANNRLMSVLDYAPRTQGARLFRDLATHITTMLPVEK